SLPGKISYRAFQPFFGSTPIRLTTCCMVRVALTTLDPAVLSLPLGLVSVLVLPLMGRSRICTILDFNIKSLPRYLLIVLALAGDSTMTSAFPMGIGIPQSVNPFGPHRFRANTDCADERQTVWRARAYTSSLIKVKRGRVLPSTVTSSANMLKGRT